MPRPPSSTQASRDGGDLDAPEKGMAAAAAAAFTPSTFAGDWAMFDQDLIVRKPAANGTEAAGFTSTGIALSVSLKLAPPPALSYIYLDCPQVVSPPTREHGPCGRCLAIGASANLLLLSIIVPVKDQDMYMYTYTEDFFVYIASSLRPALIRLPVFPDGRCFRVAEIGIVSRGIGGSFSVAALTLCHEQLQGGTFSLDYQEVAELCVFLPKDNKWHVKKLAVPYDSNKELQPFQWISSAVFSCSGKFYWVNYNIGLLSCDVFERSPKLELVKFPVPVRKVIPGLYYVIDDCPELESFRTVGVSDGKIKFVDVDRRLSPISIRTWTLRMPKMVWEEDGMLPVDHLWETSFRDLRLPRWVPQYPVVSLPDPHVVHFVLLGPALDGPIWMITVNMKTRSVLSCRNYASSETEKGDKMGIFFNAVLCSDLPKYSQSAGDRFGFGQVYPRKRRAVSGPANQGSVWPIREQWNQVQPGWDDKKHGDETKTNVSESYSTFKVFWPSTVNATAT